MASDLKSHRTRTNPLKRKVGQPFVLTDRDTRLLVELYYARAMTREQIQRLGYFTSTVRANARLRQLYDQRYLCRYPTRCGTASGALIYACGPAAINVLAQHLDDEPANISRHCRAGLRPSTLEHTLAVVDIRLAFERQTTVHLWLTEGQCRHVYSVRTNAETTWQTRILRPDAFVRFTLPNDPSVTVNAFIEADRGNVSISRFAEKLVTYTHYRADGVFADTYNAESFVIVVITTGRQRQRRLAKLAEPSELTLIATTFAALDPDGLAAAIWPCGQQLDRRFIEVLGNSNGGR